MTSKLNPSDLELNIDPSSFSSYAHVRKLVLRDQASAAKKGLEFSKLLSSFLIEPSEEQQQAEQEDTKKNSTQQIPQVC